MITLTHEELSTQLDAAIQAHGQWKHRLRQAAINKEQDLPVALISRDDRCKFGRWLYNLPCHLRNSKEAQEVTRLHARFHRAAGAVARMIADGDYDQAISSLASGGYPAVSKELVAALASWRMRVILHR